MKKKTNQTQSPQSLAKKKKQRKQKIKIITTVIILIVASVSVYLGYGIFKQVEGFSKERLMSEESSVIETADGEEWYSYNRNGARKNVTYDDLPQVLIDAVVAAEDSRFFEHNGFDLPRIVKALMGNIAAGGITGGGSTITQQVIKKSYYPDEERTIERKVGEVILSIEASSQTTKEEILELYLNKIYFGYGNKAIGIYAASRYYFDKSVQNLTLPEAALLAGAINNPNKYDPYRNLEEAQKRRNVVLDLMYRHGYITQEECDATKAIPVENTLKYNPISSNGKYQAYADRVTREVYEKTGLDPNDTPMKITTYIDLGLQEKLDEIASGDAYTFMDRQIECGATVMNNRTGAITGVLSGRNYVAMGTTYAYAADEGKENELGGYGQRNQPGSSLKPIIAYGAAFEFLDYSTAHYVHDVPISISGWEPNNWNNKFSGDTSIKDALYNSWNLAAIQTFNEVVTGKDCNGNTVGQGIGYDKMQEYLEGFGFTMANEEIGLQYAIGGWSTGVTPEDLAGAYSAIANGGTYIEPHTVSKIEILATGEVIDFEETYYQQEKHQAISEESAFMVREVMTDYVKDGGYTYGVLNLGYQIGAKSGTSNHSTDPNKVANPALCGQSKDGWLTAYSPDYSWSVWTGYNAESQKEGYYLKSNRDANNVAAIIAKYIHSDGVKNSYPSQPDGVVKATCISGIYPYVSPGEGVPDSRKVTGWFKKDNMPSGSASAASLNSLNTFTAKLNNNKIHVEFTKYNPESMTTDSAEPTKTYNIGGKSYTLRYLGSLSQIYGKVVYIAEVVDSNGKVVHTEKLSTNSADLNYKPSGGTYTINGYYAYENGSATSNKISQKITVEDTSNTDDHHSEANYSQISLSANELVLQVNVPEGSTITISVNGTNQTINQSAPVTISGLTANTEYEVNFTETTSNGKTLHLASFKFKTPEA